MYFQYFVRCRIYGKFHWLTILCEVTPECCQEGYFRTLEGLDLSYNYISDGNQISGLVYLPRMQQIILYVTRYLAQLRRSITSVWRT